MEGALLDMRAVALIIILGGAVVVYGRFSRNNPVAIVGYAVLAVGLILGS
jgi:hypothetical protein